MIVSTLSADWFFTVKLSAETTDKTSSVPVLLEVPEALIIALLFLSLLSSSTAIEPPLTVIPESPSATTDTLPSPVVVANTLSASGVLTVIFPSKVDIALEYAFASLSKVIEPDVDCALKVVAASACAVVLPRSAEVDIVKAFGALITASPSPSTVVDTAPVASAAKIVTAAFSSAAALTESKSETFITEPSARFVNERLAAEFSRTLEIFSAEADVIPDELIVALANVSKTTSICSTITDANDVSSIV